jgi:hypothetical protein
MTAHTDSKVTMPVRSEERKEKARIRLTERYVNVRRTIKGQWVAGWITSTQTLDDGLVFYGPFPSQEEALNWAAYLDNATIEPIYVPSHNAG